MTERFRVRARLALDTSYEIELPSDRYPGASTVEQAIAVDRAKFLADPNVFLASVQPDAVDLELLEVGVAIEPDHLVFLYVGGPTRAHIIKPGGRRVMCNFSRGPFIATFMYAEVPRGVPICRVCARSFGLPDRIPTEVRLTTQGSQMLALNGNGEAFDRYIECSGGCGYLIGVGDGVDTAIHLSCSED